MPDLCTSSINQTGCGHYDVTIAGRSYHVHASELAEPLTAVDIEARDRLLMRTLHQSGVSLSQFVGRVIRGEEATNVKIYSFFGPGAAITKTNIGAAYVNICPGLDGERIVVDLTGCTQYRLQLHCNVVSQSAGQLGVRVVRDGDNEVLHEAPNVGAVGERGPDTDWQDFPAAFLGQGQVYLRAQAKSTVAGDDPVFRSLRLGLR